MAFAKIFLDLIIGILSAIQWLIIKISGKKWKNIRPIANPMTGSMKWGNEEDITWDAKKLSGMGSWELRINKKTGTFKRTSLKTVTGLNMWEDVIKKRDELIKKIKNGEDIDSL